MLFCLLGIFIFLFRFWFIVTGKLVEGRIVGYSRGTNDDRHFFTAHRFRICLQYEEQWYYVDSLESTTVPNGAIPKEAIGRYVKVYFNPHTPKRVAIKGMHRLTWISVIMFLFGLLGVWLGFIIELEL
ncbi:DUF3592 domain-containing protein [Bacillaceae bacterium SIJ1]|nr:DUF3592 domain-containing protein [Litoribacterium kuwaitense]